MFKILIGLRFLFGVFFGGLEFSLTLVIGDEDACGAPKLWSFLGLSQWVYVRDDMSKGLKIMSLGVINHGMSLSVLYL
jgi:hypothetical protein